MLPIDTVFAGIRAVCSKGPIQPSLKLLDSHDNAPRRARTLKQSVRCSGPVVVPEQVVPIEDKDEEAQNAHSIPATEEAISTWLAWEALIPMLIMTNTIAFVR